MIYRQYLARASEADVGQLTQVCATYNVRIKTAPEELRDEMSEWLYSFVEQHYLDSSDAKEDGAPLYSPKSITSAKTGKMLITYNVAKEFPLMLQKVAMVYMMDCLAFLQKK